MLYVMLSAAFLALVVLLIAVTLQVNGFVKKVDDFIQQIENHIYL